MSIITESDNNTKKSDGSSASIHSIIEVEEEKLESVFERLDSYEFYTVVYAATALNEHGFNLRENLPKLTLSQRSYIYEILMKCLNRIKMDRVLQELEQMHPEEGSL